MDNYFEKVTAEQLKEDSEAVEIMLIKEDKARRFFRNQMYYAKEYFKDLLNWRIWLFAVLLSFVASCISYPTGISVEMVVTYIIAFLLGVPILYILVYIFLMRKEIWDSIKNKINKGWNKDDY